MPDQNFPKLPPKPEYDDSLRDIFENRVIDGRSEDEANAEMFAKAHGLFLEKVQSHQLMCRIYDAYAGPSAKNHNCLGCNFNDLTEQFSDYLGIAGKGMFQVHHAYTLYFFISNAIWERITDIFDILSVPEPYRARHYRPLIRVRRWANFFKHPKEFGWLAHHPVYTIEGSEVAKTSCKNQNILIIDEDFLKKYYSADRSKGLAAEFNGKESNVVVLLPELLELTSLICDCLEDFVKVVTQNPVYFEILTDKATVMDYFERSSETSEKIEAKFSEFVKGIAQSSLSGADQA